jgi:hypothetical protein
VSLYELVSLRLDLFVTSHASPFIAERGACTKVLGPDMWTQGHKEYSTWGYKCLLMEQSSCALTSKICVCRRDDEYSAPLGTGALFVNRLDRRAVYWMTLTLSTYRLDRAH